MTLETWAQGKDADLLEGRGLGQAWERIFADTDAAIQSDDGCTATAVLVWRAASGNLCIQVLLTTDWHALNGLHDGRALCAVELASWMM